MLRWTKAHIVLVAAAVLLGCYREPPAGSVRSLAGEWESVVDRAALHLSLYGDGTGCVHVWTVFDPEDRIPLEIVGWSADLAEGTISIKVMSPGASEEREMGGEYEWAGEKLLIHHVSEEGAVETRTYRRVGRVAGAGGGDHD